MQAIVNRVYGSPDVMRLEEVEKPVPGDHEVLIKIHAASVNAADWHVLRADPFLTRFLCGFFKPKFTILGADVSGRVEAVGAKVTQFKPGDAVFGDVCECGWGGFAEYTCAHEDMLVHKPANLTFSEAAAVPFAAVTAYKVLKHKGRVQPGHNVLINGASGGVGTFAVQIARALGAEVTAVCSTGNLDMVRNIGAHHVVDYKRDDFTKNGQTYDLIFAANGYHWIYDYKRSLTPNGVYITTGGTGTQLLQAAFLGPWIALTSSNKVHFLSSVPNKQDLSDIKALIEEGKVKPVIDRRYPLAEVPQAVRYLEEGHAKGKVVITIFGENETA